MNKMLESNESDSDECDADYAPSDNDVSSVESCNESEQTTNTKVDTEVSSEKANDIWKSFLDEVDDEKKNNEEQSLSKSQESNKKDSPATDKGKTIFEFAGEIVEVEKTASEVNKKDTNQSASSTAEDTSAIKKRKGLTSVLGTLTTKKQKLNTLEKSLLDWKQYKKEEDIEDELAVYNRGKNGYIERQRFLERSDLRSYEMERDARLSTRKKTSNI